MPRVVTADAVAATHVAGGGPWRLSRAPSCGNLEATQRERSRVPQTGHIRPVRTYSTGAVTTWLRRCCLVGIGLVTCVLGVRWVTMAEAVELPFGSDQYLGRGALAAIAGGAVALALLIAYLSRIPRWQLYSAEVTEENAQFVYREGERFWVWLLVALLGVYLGLALSAFGVNGIGVSGVSILSIPILSFVQLARVSNASMRKASGSPET